MCSDCKGPAWALSKGLMTTWLVPFDKMFMKNHDQKIIMMMK